MCVRACVHMHGAFMDLHVYIYICENVRGNEDEFACVRACVRASTVRVRACMCILYACMNA